jgi:hypothetical protein
MRLALKVGNIVSFFDKTANRIRAGGMIEKTLKHVSLQDEKDPYHFFKSSYCARA